jgi:hypothetical protein
MKKSLLAAVLAIAASGIANATIKVDTPTITSVAGGSAWNYFVNGDGVETAVNTTTYFTIYDFAGYIASSAVAPIGWSVSVQNVGVTPVGVTVPDSPALVNITWTFTGQNGTPIPVSQVGGFIADSSDPTTSTTLGYYTYQAFNPSPGVNTNDAGYGQVLTPSAVPEPMSMALVGAGLALVGVARLRRRNA